MRNVNILSSPTCRIEHRIEAGGMDTRSLLKHNTDAACTSNE